MTDFFELFGGTIPDYLSGLDWTYITTFTLLSYIFLRLPIRQWMQKRWNFQLRTRYWVAFIGFANAVVRAAALTMGGPELLTLLQSFVFAMIFYQLLLDVLVRWLEQRFLGNALAWFKWFAEAGDQENTED